MIALMLVLLVGLHVAVFLVDQIWNWRKIILPLLLAAHGVLFGLSIVTLWPLYWLIIALPTTYQLINLFRVGYGRRNQDDMRNSGLRSTLVLLAYQLLAIGVVGIGPRIPLTIAALVQPGFAFVIFVLAARNLIKTRHESMLTRYTDQELPTLTVAVPARNETVELSSCLTSIVASNYPKLEVLVLDDCSSDRTPEIIRDFAQDGVRFVAGDEPEEHWLAKNQAYEKLYKAASGEIVLFAGVDVRFGPEAIRALVTTMLYKKRDMISLMPLRIGGGVRTAFVQPMRYWWELAFPRRLFNRPPTLSTCWLIKRKTLKKLGGFGAVSQAINPESFFARELVKNDSYAFTRADEVLDVRTVKSVADQLATAVRARYPQLKKRPENVLVLTIVEIGLLLMPFVIFLSGFFVGFGVIQWFAGVAALMHVTTHYMIMAASNPANSVIALFNYPLVILTELTLVHLSMFKYEFGKVEWKDRNVCIPILERIPRLPSIY